MLQWLLLATALAGVVELEVDTVDFLPSESLRRSVSPVLTQLHVLFEDQLAIALPSRLALGVRLIANVERFGHVEVRDGDSAAERVGYFDPRQGLVVVWHRGDERETRRVVQHEVVHYYATMAGLAGVPAWLREGLAEVGATATLDGDGKVWLEPDTTAWAHIARRPRPRASALIGLDPATWGSLGIVPEYPYGWALCAFLVETEAGRRTLSALLTATATSDDPGAASLAVVERTWPGGVADLDASFARWTPGRVHIPPRASGATSEVWARCPDGSLIRRDAGTRCSRWVKGADGLLRFVEEDPLP